MALKNKHLFLTVLEAGNPRSGCLHSKALSECPLPGLQRVILLCPHTVERELTRPLASSSWGLVPFLWAPAFQPSKSSKAPPPNTITWGLGIHLGIFKEHKHSVLWDIQRGGGVNYIWIIREMYHGKYILVSHKHKTSKAVEKKGRTEEEHVEWKKGKAHDPGVCQCLPVQQNIDLLQWFFTKKWI